MDEAYLPLKWHLDPSSRFSTTGMRRKLAVPLWGRGSWVPSNSVAWDEAYLRTKLHLDPFSRLTTTDMVDFFGGRRAVSLWRRGAGPPFNTIWLTLRPTSVPSFILIRQTVWPRCTNVTDRQADNGPIT